MYMWNHQRMKIFFRNKFYVTLHWTHRDINFFSSSQWWEKWACNSVIPDTAHKLHRLSLGMSPTMFLNSPSWDMGLGMSYHFPKFFTSLTGKVNKSLKNKKLHVRKRNGERRCEAIHATLTVSPKKIIPKVKLYFPWSDSAWSILVIFIFFSNTALFSTSLS